LTLAASLSLCLKDGLGNLVPQNLQGPQRIGLAFEPILNAPGCILGNHASGEDLEHTSRY
jgi:hypothetical protein